MIKRSPEGGESGGGVATMAEPAVTESVTPETQSTEAVEVQGEKKAPVSDWERYQKLQEKGNNPNAKFSKADQALAKKYEGKDESEIQGYVKPSQQDDDSSPEPEAKPKPEVKEENPLHKLIGAKSDSEVTPKVQGLINQLKQYQGERGEVGRVLEGMGAKTLGEAKQYVQNASSLHQLVKDLQAGKPEAFQFIGLNQNQPNNNRGAVPDDVLDEGLYNFISPQIKAANDRAERLERELQMLKGEWAPIRESQAQASANMERMAHVSDVVNEVNTLISSTEGLWDSSKSGSLTKALTDYYNSTGDYNPALKPVLEIIDLAKDNGINNLDIALRYWEHKNGGSLIAKARDDARQPFLGKRPSVGLSDQQGNHNGQFKSYTEAHIKEMVAGKRSVPREWTDSHGTIVQDKIPSHLRSLIFSEE